VFRAQGLGRNADHRRGQPKRCATTPTRAPPRTSHAVFTRKRKRSAAATMAVPTVTASTRAARAKCQVTAAIKPREATLSPSRNPAAQREARSFGMIR